MKIKINETDRVLIGHINAKNKVLARRWLSQDLARLTCKYLQDLQLTRLSKRGQSWKSEDFDQNTKNGLKSSVSGFINRQNAQNDGDLYFYMIWDEKNFMV